MAILAQQSINRLGLAPAYAAASAGGDSFLPGRDTILHAKNASGAAITITVITQSTDPIGNLAATPPIVVPAGGERMIGPFPATQYANPVTGNADMNYSAVASLTIGAFTTVKP